MALAQAESIYSPRIFDDPDGDMWGFRESTFALWDAPTKQRMDLLEMTDEPLSDAALHLIQATRHFLAPVAIHRFEHVQESTQKRSVSVVWSLIDKALRDRCERRTNLDTDIENRNLRDDLDLRVALERHIRNQFASIASQGGEMLGDPETRDTMRRLLDKLRVLLDESEQVLAAPSRLRDAVRRELLHQPMFSADDIVANHHARLDTSDLDEWRTRSILLALPTEDGYRYPQFQFAANWTLYEVVREINERLDAVQDPWGVASWWFSEHVRLGGRPADLVDPDSAGMESDDRHAAGVSDRTQVHVGALVAAAQAITGPVG